MANVPSDIAHEIAQDCISKAPVVLLGSGLSAAYGIPGMPKLRDYLLSCSRPSEVMEEEINSWDRFIERLKGADLETALTDVNLPELITKYIVTSTWNFLNPHDISVFNDYVIKHFDFPLTRLYRHLFKSTHNEIDVITPNYDRIAEYAADLGGMCHYTGFGYGHLRPRATGLRPKLMQGSHQVRTVNVWKVHGSLDWFRDRDGVVVALPITTKPPLGFEPTIITPGIEKYRLTHDEPFLTIKQSADNALQTARSYLCIGYGFNDTHVQTKLVERCRTEPIPLILITKNITSTARTFLGSGKCLRYMALEKSPNGCRLFCTEYPAGIEIEHHAYWSLDNFLTLVMS